jgi:hypothetical protein
VAHIYNPSYLGSGDWKDHNSRPAWAKTQDSVQKITKAKRAEDVAQVTERLPSKHKALSSKFSIAKQRKWIIVLKYI